MYGKKRDSSHFFNYLATFKGHMLLPDSQPGNIVILNGPSAVGKTSIQEALQKKSKIPFLKVGIDTFFDSLIEEPDLSEFEIEKKFEQYTPEGEYIRGVALEKDDAGFPVVPLTIGTAGDRIILGMHRAISQYAQVGNNLVVDYILYKPTWAEDLKDILKSQKVLFVKVSAPLEEIERREKARKTSPVGHARSHYEYVHEGFNYDLELDTSLLTPEESADKILKCI